MRPEFSRIYRYDQLVDVAMSKPAGRRLAGAYKFRSKISELQGLFDGSEETIAILDVPV
ncbi:MAG: hypothetical protein KDK75_01830 [Alphaproteobacteria bacterium]|nr:hypothetical protein [Alphaproteobacteria bacterium]